MTMLLTDIQLPAGDLAGAPQATQSVPAKRNQGGAEFSGILRSSLNNAADSPSVQSPQAVDLNKVNSVELSSVEGQLVDWQAQQITDTLPGAGESEVGGLNALLVAELEPGDIELDSDAELTQFELEELITDEGGMILPPFAVGSSPDLSAELNSQVLSAGGANTQQDLADPDLLTAPGDKLIDNEALAMQSTIDGAEVAGQAAVNSGQTSNNPALRTSIPGQATVAQAVTTANQGDLTSGGNGTNAGLQQSANAMPAVDTSAELANGELRVNTLTQTGQASNSTVTTINVPAGNVANAPVGTAAAPSSMVDTTSVSLQSMSLGKGETSGDIGNGLAERVQWMINHRQNTANIRLDPPLLGRLDVQVKVMDDVATITIQTQQGMTRDMIDAASYRLRDALQDSGFEQVNVDVSHREDTGHADNQQLDDSPSQQTAMQEVEQSATIGDQASSESWVNGYTVSGLVDTFA